MDSCRTVKTVFERHNEVTAPQLPFTHCQLSIFFLSLFSRCGRTARHGRVGILSRVRARPFTVKKLLLSAGIVALLWKSLS